MIGLEQVSFGYGEKQETLSHVSATVARGECVLLCGASGCGKTTVTKLINGLIPAFTPGCRLEGQVMVNGLAPQETPMYELAQRVGSVFQNPKSQFFNLDTDSELAFGLENEGRPPEEIRRRVERVAETLHLQDLRGKNIFSLSGGQKQLLAFGSVYAMGPEIYVLDEPTAMLDPNGRKDVIRAARALNDVENVTIILITHYMEEVIYADRVFVMDEGKVVMQGTPREIFSQVERLKHLRLDVPQVTLLAYELQKSGLKLPDGILTAQELTEELKKLCTGSKTGVSDNRQMPVKGGNNGIKTGACKLFIWNGYGAFGACTG